MKVVGVLFVEHNYKESQLIMIPVCHQVEHLIFVIVHNLLDGCDQVLVIKVNCSIRLCVEKDGILCFSNNNAVLRIVERKELGLLSNGVWEFAECSHAFGFVIKLDDSVFLCKQEDVRVLTFYFGDLKVELHAQAGHFFNFKKNHSLREDKDVCVVNDLSFKDKQLVCLLLVFDQILACDDSKRFLIFTDLETNDPVDLSGL